VTSTGVVGPALLWHVDGTVISSSAVARIVDA